MKKLYTLIALAIFLPGAAVNAQNCNAGYESPVFPNTMPIPPNIAFAIRVTVANPGTLTDLCMWNSGLSAINMKMAVYADNSGMPGNLVASTAPFQLTSTQGAVAVPVTPVYLLPGNYYLAGVISASGSPIAVDNTTSVTIYQMAMPFNSSFPANGSGFSSANGNPVNIWMNITCSNTGIQESPGLLSMEGYPVPAQDVYSMNFHSATAMEIVITLFNSSGQQVLESQQRLDEGENKIDLLLNGLAEGIYFLRITDESRKLLLSRKLVKE